MLSKFVNANTASTSGSGTLPSNTITNPKVDLKGITTRSGVAYQGPTIPTTTSSPSKVVERETEVTKDIVPPTNNRSTKDVQPPVVQVQTHVPNSEPVVAPVSALMPNLKLTIPYPSRHALILMQKFASTLKALIRNKEKLSKMARTPLNEHCSAVILNKLPKKLGDPGKFLIPCDFPRMDECLALADLGASINLMPLSMWEKLSLPELTPTCMTLELADRSIIKPIGIAKDVYVKVGKFKLLADFVVVDFDADPRVPLFLGRSFLKTGRDLIDVYKGELTLRVEKEAITFNLDQTSRYSSNYNDNSVNRIDVIEMDCEEYSQEILGFSDVITSGNPTPYYDPIVSTSSPTLTPFGHSDILLEEVDAFLALEDDPTSPEVDDFYYDPEGDILLFESFLNDDPSPPPTQGNYLPEIRKEAKVYEAKTDKSSIDEPPEVELKDLPPHLEYAFLEGDNKLPVIIAKDLSVEEKAALIKVLKSHKRAIAWKLSNIKGINPENLYTRILIEEDYKTQRCTPKTGESKNPRYVHPKGGTFQRCMMAIFHDMIEKMMEVFMDDFLVFGNSFKNCLSRVDKMLQKIEVDKAKVDVIAKLPHPTTVKGVQSFLDWDLPYVLMCDASDFAIEDVLRKLKSVGLDVHHFPRISYGTVEFISQQGQISRLRSSKIIALLWSGILVSVRCQKSGHLATRLGCAETKVATWDDLAFKLIIVGWNQKQVPADTTKQAATLKNSNFQSLQQLVVTALQHSMRSATLTTINGFDMPLPVAVCSGLVNPLAPRKGPRIMETQAIDDQDHLVNYDNDNENDNLGYQSEEYLDEADEEDENNHSNGNVVKRGITRLYKFRRCLKILSWKKVDSEARDKLWEENTRYFNVDLTVRKLVKSAAAKMAHSKSVYQHTMGRGGYALVKEKMIKKKEIEPDEEPPRGTLWLNGRVNKDRKYPDDEIRSVGDKLKETEDKIKEGTLKVDHGTDAMTVVLGKEKGGYARRGGSGVTYKRYFDLPRSRQASDEKNLLLQSQLDNERLEHQEKELLIHNLSNKMLQTEGMVTKLKNQLAAQGGQLQSMSTQLTPTNVRHFLLSSVDINPINSSADKEGGTTVVGCENGASIQKSNGLATLEKEMETREIVKFVGSKKMTRSIRKDSSRQDSQSQENVSPLLVLPQAIKCKLWHLNKSTIIALGIVYKTDGKQMLHNK
ncbi:reverse transcriptase domain-containing protein [Tanacetum coccineum]